MTATTPGPLEHRVGSGAFDARTLLTSLPDAVRKLDPRQMWRSPVMFVVLVGAVLTTVSAVVDPSSFAWWITAWLWLTVVFANLAEAVGADVLMAPGLPDLESVRAVCAAGDGVDRAGVPSHPAACSLGAAHR